MDRVLFSEGRCYVSSSGVARMNGWYNIQKEQGTAIVKPELRELQTVEQTRGMIPRSMPRYCKAKRLKDHGALAANT